MDPMDPMDNQNPNPGGDKTLEHDKVLSDDELNNLSEEELRKQLKTTMYQKLHFREKFSKADEELQKLKGSNIVPPATVVPPAPVTTVQPVDHEAVARKVAMDMKRDEMLLGIPEDKRESVKGFYDAISNGKQVDITNIGTYMQAAMGAAGIAPTVNSANRVISSSPGAVPPRTMPGPTPEQVALAQRLGNDPAKVYGKEVDLSGMLNPEKFFSDEKKELI